MTIYSAKTVSDLFSMMHSDKVRALECLHRLNGYWIAHAKP